ncbi:MAG: tRNA (N(6)-L-threonylcarbamoyladenosine(37)-C(2))-methylthiotransferase MtaB, partial [Deltaproteobacteria bacterium]|nr:tRNA (N(6)-L-threonylcarbamoyladenosine(37)-C(2))-methylthiotransferase MtaB [Deltaproteobacteria bacterium]
MSISPTLELRVLIETLGCKVNFYESQGLAAGFRQAGWQVVKKAPFDAVVINSCAVTAEAGRQSLQAVRRAVKRYPEALVVLAGCEVAAESEKVLAMKELGAIFGNAGKKDLVARLTLELSGKQAAEAKYQALDFSGELEIDALRADSDRGRSRAVVKVQDGCNSFCRYCIIPYLRGRCRSLEPDKVLAECRGLVAAGFREVVLTGIHLGRYGDDAGKSFSLTSLLLRMVEKFPDLRIRLGSLQPHEITPEIIALLLDPGVPVCEHLHLSLQSASDRVLGAMGRPYRQPEIEAIFAELAAGRGRIAIGTDLIVGFPAETGSAFAETCSVVEKSPLTYLHVFPYSPRQGTVAGSWPDRVSGAEKKSRAKKLADLGREKRDIFARENLGAKLNVLLESKREGDSSGPAWFG